MTQLANSPGWEVQQYSDDTGWTAVTEPLPTKAEAYRELELYTVDPELQFRVYESLS